MSDFETEVKDGLKANSGKLDELLIWRAVLDERCGTHRQQTDDVRETLYGNPNGVVKKVNSLWNGKKYASKQRDFWMYVLKIVVAAGVIGLVSWMLLVYKVIKIGG